MNNAQIAQNFIEAIWNQQEFTRLADFLHPDFTDYSLPPMLKPDLEGTKSWINHTGASFEHRTHIEKQVTEADETILKITMHLKHTGAWRGIEPTGLELQSAGYRHFKFKDGKIIAHWALIDGQAIENQLKNAAHGCKIAE